MGEAPKNCPATVFAKYFPCENPGFLISNSTFPLVNLAQTLLNHPFFVGGFTYLPNP